ncbi:MAG: type 1 glutamine amidotransferase domain-containing protein [Candidatus Sumerlaeaceae bacterium]
MASLAGKKVLIITEDIYEDLELWYPKLRLIEEGAEVDVATPKIQKYTGKNGYPLEPDLTIDDVKTRDYAALVVPGGYAPDKLRRYPRALEIVRDFDADKRPIAFICHGGWVPISARIVKGVRLTSVNALKDDLENAGATWVDQGCVRDGHIITAQVPKDLPDFCRALITAMQERL